MKLPVRPRGSAGRAGPRRVSQRRVSQSGVSGRRVTGRLVTLCLVTVALPLALAACGTTVANSTSSPRGTGSPGRHGLMPRIQPGGPAKPSTARTNVCREIPLLTQVEVVREPKLGNTHGRMDRKPMTFMIRDAANARSIAHTMCGLPAFPRGPRSCPADFGNTMTFNFGASGRVFSPVTVQMSGCRAVSGLMPTRSWDRDQAMTTMLGTVTRTKGRAA
jgi:hypothetical protein